MARTTPRPHPTATQRLKLLCSPPGAGSCSPRGFRLGSIDHPLPSKRHHVLPPALMRMSSGRVTPAGDRHAVAIHTP
jgi:hypothetical protein